MVVEAEKDGVLVPGKSIVIEPTSQSHLKMLRLCADVQAEIQVSMNNDRITEEGADDRHWPGYGMRTQGVLVYHHSTSEDEFGKGSNATSSRCRDCQDTVSISQSLWILLTA
jgi:hypothetical protein